MSSFKKNPKVEEELELDPWMGVMLRERLELAESLAKAAAPVDTGAYRDGIHGEVAPIAGKWAGRLNANDFKSVWIEFGTATGYAAHATLRQACEKAGFLVQSTR